MTASFPSCIPSNSVANLTLAQLKSIYKGDITNWKEVGGPDRKIVVVSRDTSSGTYEVWEGKVMSKERVYPGALLQASNGAVAQAVAQEQKTPSATSALGYMNNDVKGLTVKRDHRVCRNHPQRYVPDFQAAVHVHQQMAQG